MIGAGEMQIAQVGPRQFEIRYVARDWGVPPDEARFSKKFREVLFEELEITLVPLATIPPIEGREVPRIRHRMGRRRLRSEGSSPANASTISRDARRKPVVAAGPA